MKISKKQKVLNHLKAGGSLTAISAYQLCRTTRLSGLIFLLKKEGYNIGKTMEGEGQEQYARYYLIKD